MDHPLDMTILAFVWILLGIHVIADFVLQTPWMAENKSKNFNALCDHCVVYTLTFTPLFFFFPPYDVVTFLSFTNALHLMVDYITSKWTAYLWKEKRVHDFFVVIGFDQFIHAFILTATGYYVLLHGNGLPS